eukprot:symbB.v1.2.033850.t2/scaffold4263.1/size42195/1
MEDAGVEEARAAGYIEARWKPENADIVEDVIFHMAPRIPCLSRKSWLRTSLCCLLVGARGLDFLLLASADIMIIFSAGTPLQEWTLNRFHLESTAKHLVTPLHAAGWNVDYFASVFVGNANVFDAEMQHETVKFPTQILKVDKPFTAMLWLNVLFLLGIPCLPLGEECPEAAAGQSALLQRKTAVDQTMETMEPFESMKEGLALRPQPAPNQTAMFQGASG